MFELQLMQALLTYWQQELNAIDAILISQYVLNIYINQQFS